MNRLRTQNNSLDLVYSHYIRPLSYNEKVIIVQKILQDFIEEEKTIVESKEDRLINLRRFKGIGTQNVMINEEDWYKQ